MRQDKGREASSARFLAGVVKASDVAKLFLDGVPKVAFAGRSNVGKSSLLNSLTGTKVARTSSQPGKTREMNFFSFLIGKREVALVDLPGYGFAKVSQSLRSQWGDEISKWMTTDPDLCLVVSLVDGRLGFMPTDVELLKFLAAKKIPALVVFTKMDKWKSNNQRKNAERDLEKKATEIGLSHILYVSVQEKKTIGNVLSEIRDVLTHRFGS